jgi:hypothetical protein
VRIIMKIIDFELLGNVIRFYLGADDCTDYTGDDWDDTPYEHNAGTVYDEYVIATVDVALSADYRVVEPATEVANSVYCKDDFKARRAPCLLVYPADDSWYECNPYAKNIGREDAARIYFGDDVNVRIVQMMDLFGAHAFGFQMREAAHEDR